MMRKKWMAVFLSLFVMPGFGHVYLGQKKKGYLISLAVSVVVFGLLVAFEWELARLAGGLENPRMILSSIFDLAKQAWMAHRLLYWTGLVLLATIWLLAALDLLGRKQNTP